MSTKPTVQAFEFTKRKRWSETLFSELSETIAFVLSPTCKVWYCGAGIIELLGWKEDQLVDADLAEFLDYEDQESFRWTFTEALRSGQDLFTYARFKLEQPSADPNSRTSQLFEVKGHPHYTHGHQGPRCFFLTALPYPSRNVSMLNTFLDLKIENEILSRRINELKNSVASSSLDLHSPQQFSMSNYPQRFNHPSGPLVPNHPYLYSRSASGQTFFSTSEPSGSNIHNARRPSLPGSDKITSPIQGEDGDENGHRKKKTKKTLVGDEQRVCVTCGRTDSPEWRKGPLGPKTLCNACGLRWAKRTRKTDPDTGTPQATNPTGACDDQQLTY